MKEFINLIIIVLLSIVYLVMYTKIQQQFFNKKFALKNNALTILFLSSLLSSGIVLIDISKAISDAFNFYYSDNLFFGAIFSVLFFAGAFGFSLGLFHLSFSLTSFLTKEDERTELLNNNIELSIIHSLVIVILALVIAPALLQLFSSFIPYPDRPF